MIMENLKDISMLVNILMPLAIVPILQLNKTITQIKIDIEVLKTKAESRREN